MPSQGLGRAWRCFRRKLAASGNARSEEPHKWGVPLAKQSLFKSFTRFFFWQSKRKRKSLAKRKARIGDFAACARRPTLRALDRRSLLKKRRKTFNLTAFISPTNQNLKLKHRRILSLGVLLIQRFKYNVFICQKIKPQQKHNNTNCTPRASVHNRYLGIAHSLKGYKHRALQREN